MEPTEYEKSWNAPATGDGNGEGPLEDAVQLAQKRNDDQKMHDDEFSAGFNDGEAKTGAATDEPKLDKDGKPIKKPMLAGVAGEAAKQAETEGATTGGLNLQAAVEKGASK